jgi:hypothetical protein
VATLETTVKQARKVAEEGARAALKQAGVEQYESWPGQTPEQRKLQTRLRAHGRQLGDRLDATGVQTIDRLVGECAYEHWHRLLFARFLAENGLLIEPESGVALSMDDCRELARERGTDWLSLASGFAQRMLPQIFRSGDPVLEVTFPPEKTQKLEELLQSLPTETFTAGDTLGWVYQYWQAEEKDRINKSEKKIGADELPAVTQLFTEDYMVLFLLHNTLGAWWTAKRKAEGLDPVLSGYEWTYLRFNDDDTPAAGAFEGWPRAAKDIKVLDPCMGSGHFLAFALPILVGFRMEEEGLSRAESVHSVLRDNLFGLEIDPRCTQIAAFNLAFTAWRIAGYDALPPINVACSGPALGATEDEWAALAGNDDRAKASLRQLYSVFEQAPALGSLIDPRRVAGDLFSAEFEVVRPLLDEALTREHKADTTAELLHAAASLAHAATILCQEFTLVATNVPYLQRGDQAESLALYCSRFHPAAKADLATCFLERCTRFASTHGSIAAVVPQNWLFLHSYRKLRETLLRKCEWGAVVRLGAHAFKSISGEVVKASLVILARKQPSSDHSIMMLDVSSLPAQEKDHALQRETAALIRQASQLSNPDSRILHGTAATDPGISLLGRACDSFLGLGTGDYARYGRMFWELPTIDRYWAFQQGSSRATAAWTGRERVIAWDEASDSLRGMTRAARAQVHGQDQSGRPAWGQTGVAVNLMGDLNCTLYSGERHDKAVAVLRPRSEDLLPALWSFCSSPDFRALVRKLDQKVIVANGTLLKVPFDETRWRIAAAAGAARLPAPATTDPTQWLFDGNPGASAAALQVAVARLLGYRWPRQTGSSFADCPALEHDGLESYADEDGIVCLSPLKGEASAADRLSALLGEAFSGEWSGARQAELLKLAGFKGKRVDDWLQDDFFEQHCELFHQRPFVWHIWDGQRAGFSALVNYHRLAGPNGEGRRTLEKLVYTYLGAWIERQADEKKRGVGGAEGRCVAAQHLKGELERILVGEPPYDVFVRWKPLHEQAVGWEPDLHDGTRLNIRPFMSARPLGATTMDACILRTTPKRVKWAKDPGKEVARSRDDYPWFWGWDGSAPDFRGSHTFDGNRWNDLHYSRALKVEARARRARSEAEMGK